MTKDQISWKDQRCLLITTIGYRSSLMTVREFWSLTLSPTVVALSTTVGLVAGLTMGIALRTAGDPTYLYQAFFAIAPVLVNLISGLITTAVAYLRLGVGGGRITQPIVVPATLTVLLACMVPIVSINLLKVAGGGLDPDWLLFMFFASPIVYVGISDFLHYVALEHIAPSVWRRGPVHELDAATLHAVNAQPVKPDLDASGDQLSVAPHTVEQTQNWYDLRRLSIWIAGYRTSLMSIRELWRVVFSKTVLALTLFIGSAAGVASAITLRAVGDSTWYYLLLFVIAPVIVNILSASMMSVVVWVATKKARPANTAPRTITVPSAITILLAAYPVVSSIYLLKSIHDGFGFEWAGFALIIVAVVYDLISDFFHYIVFRFVAPTIWQRSHIYGSEPALDPNLPDPDEATTATDNAEPEVAPPASHAITLGETKFLFSDLLFLEAQGNYLRIVTTHQDTLERFRISEATRKLPAEGGILIHRSRWVAFSGVERFEVVGMNGSVKMKNGDALQIAMTRKADVVDAFTKRNIRVSRPKQGA